MSKKSVVEEELLKLYGERGVLIPEEVVEVASVTSHPLHGFFEWDDRKAGRQYRLAQATQLIRRVEIKVMAADNDYRIRAFHPLVYVGREAPGYIHESDINSTERSFLLQTMHREWTAMRRRYSHMTEFWSLVRGEGEQAAG